MSKKDYYKGIETATKANESFMRKQAKATEELGKRVINRIDEQGEVIDVILDDLSKDEMAKLYGIQKSDDISTLDENEKYLLVSYLLTLISSYGQDTDIQKKYYFAVKRFLGVAEPSKDLDLTYIENVDSKTDSKMMFRTVCEFLFLKNANFDFLEIYDDELSYFGQNRRIVNEITSSINDVYRLLGIDGFLEHYCFSGFEEENEKEEEKQEVKKKGEIYIGKIEIVGSAALPLCVGDEIVVYIVHNDKEVKGIVSDISNDEKCISSGESGELLIECDENLDTLLLLPQKVYRIDGSYLGEIYFTSSGKTLTSAINLGKAAFDLFGGIFKGI